MAKKRKVVKKGARDRSPMESSFERTIEENRELKKKIQELEQGIVLRDERIKTLDEIEDGLRQRIDEASREMGRMTNENCRLRDKAATLEQKLDDKIAQLRTKLDYRELQIDELCSALTHTATAVRHSS